MKKFFLLIITLCLFTITGFAFDWAEGWKFKAGVNQRHVKGFEFNQPSLVYENMIGTVAVPGNTITGIVWNEEAWDDFLELNMGHNDDPNPPQNGIHLRKGEEDVGVGLMSWEEGYVPVTHTSWSSYYENTSNVWDNSKVEESDETDSGVFLEISKKLCQIKDNEILLDIGFSNNKFCGNSSATPLTQNIYLQKTEKTEYVYYYWLNWDEYNDNSLDQSFGTYYANNSQAEQAFDNYCIENGYSTKPGDKTVVSNSIAAVFRDTYSTGMDVSLNTFSLGTSMNISLWKEGKFSVIPGLGMSLNQIDMEGIYSERFYNETTGEILAQLNLKEDKSYTEIGAYAFLKAEINVLSDISIGVSARYDYVPEKSLQVGPSEMSFDGSGYSGQAYVSYKV